MNLHLYKIIKLDNYSNEDDFEKTQVMTEKDLRNEFYWALNNNVIPLELIEDYKQDPDYSGEDWQHPETNLKIGTIIDMMNNICNYISGTGYYILETDIEVEFNRAMVVRWINTLNYWENDIRDIAEKFDYKYGMYEKYNKVINEFYRLLKGE